MSGEEYFKLHGTPESAVAAFRSDLELMVSNCLEYNPVGNPYHKLGRDMGDYISPMLELLESGLSNSKAQ